MTAVGTSATTILLDHALDDVAVATASLPVGSA